ncbi:MAG: hypothetical protein IJC21_05295, partial [Lentisphaeria bacterium]|nr:hypothetical protein [Lentisphaeria bacterium]
MKTQKNAPRPLAKKRFCGIIIQSHFLIERICCMKKSSLQEERVKTGFTLIELLVSKTCQICVSPLYYFQKSTPLFLKGERGAGREGNFFSREKK